MTAQPEETPAEVYRGEIAPRRFAVALLLGLLMPGLGHVYCGHLRRGLTLYFLVLVAGATLCGVAWGANIFLPRALLMAAVAWCGLQVAFARQVARWTGESGREFVLRGHNHPLVYVGLILALEVLPAILGASVASRLVLVELAVNDRNGFPELLVGDRVYGARGAFAGGAPQRGELVVVEGVASGPTILRVVAVPGDEVALDNGTVVVNGRRLYREPLGRLEVVGRDPVPAHVEAIRAFREFAGDVAYEVYVPDGLEPEDRSPIALATEHFFLLADLRGVDGTVDSRAIGPVHARHIVGKPRYVWWSSHLESGRIRWQRIGIEVL